MNAPIRPDIRLRFRAVVARGWARAGREMADELRALRPAGGKKVVSSRDDATLAPRKRNAFYSLPDHRPAAAREEETE